MDKRKALLVVDVQAGLFKKRIAICRSDDLLNIIAKLVDRAHSAGAPVVFVQHQNKVSLAKGSDAWQLHQNLHPIEEDLVIHKQSGNAFHETELHSELMSRNIKHIVVTGLVTHGCVKATCIGAKELGYEVTLVEDGHSSYHEKAADLIEEWNKKLASEVCVEPANSIEFDVT